MQISSELASSFFEKDYCLCEYKMCGLLLKKYKYCFFKLMRYDCKIRDYLAYIFICKILIIFLK